MKLETLVLFCLLLISIAGALILYLRWYFNYWHKRGVIGPKPQLLCGTFPKSTAGHCNLIEELHEIYLEFKLTQKYVGVFTARTPKLFILDPQLALQILTQHFKHFHDNESSQWTRPSAEQLRLCSPFVSTGESWKERRAELVPTLTANRIRLFYAAMRECADKATKFISATQGEVMDAKKLAHRYTAEFMANYIWGVEANAFNTNNTQNVKVTTTSSAAPIPSMVDAMLSQTLDCVRYYGRTAAWPWLRLLRPVRFFPAISDRFFQQLLVDAWEARCGDETQRKHVIDHLQQLSNKKSLNDIQIVGHTTTVLIDGYETAALLIAHTLLLLARNTRVQEKLRMELLNDEVATCDSSFEALNGLPYLEQCLYETLRLFPPLPTLFKLCTDPIILARSDGNAALSLRPGDAVYISAYSFHRDADYFENPEEFWPERFAEELGGVRKYRDMGVFLPFGDGPRMCPGMKLGLAEAKIAVAEIIKKFRLKQSEQTRTDNKIEENSFLLTLKGGIKLIFEVI